MNSYRVDVQTPNGLRQHMVKGKNEADVSARVKDRVYRGVDTYIEGVYLRGETPEAQEPVDYFAEITQALRAQPRKSANQLAGRCLSLSRETVLKYLCKMEEAGLVTHEEQTIKGRRVKIWSLAEKEKRAA